MKDLPMIRSMVRRRLRLYKLGKYTAKNISHDRVMGFVLFLLGLLGLGIAPEAASGIQPFVMRWAFFGVSVAGMWTGFVLFLASYRLERKLGFKAVPLPERWFEATIE